MTAAKVNMNDKRSILDFFFSFLSLLDRDILLNKKKYHPIHLYIYFCLSIAICISNFVLAEDFKESFFFYKNGNPGSLDVRLMNII